MSRRSTKQSMSMQKFKVIIILALVLPNVVAAMVFVCFILLDSRVNEMSEKLTYVTECMGIAGDLSDPSAPSPDAISNYMSESEVYWDIVDFLMQQYNIDHGLDVYTPPTFDNGIQVNPSAETSPMETPTPTTTPRVPTGNVYTESSGFKYIDEVDSNTWSKSEMELALRILISEAGAESYEGQCAVVQCMLDRIKCGYGDTLLDVLTASGQFATPYYGDISLYPSCSQAINAVLNNGYRVYDTDIIYFYNPATSDAEARAWLETHPYIGQIGNHVFRGD